MNDDDEDIFRDHAFMIGTIQSKEREWASVANQYLPISQDDSVWRFSVAHPAKLPKQGWKIHISATILSAAEVLAAVGPMLNSTDMYFKGVCSLAELKKLNCGLHYGFSQVGKLLTIYVNNESELRSIAPKLHRVTEHLCGPSIPYDVPYSGKSVVFYRYGAFQGHEIITNDGDTIPDARQPHSAIPPTIKDPFAETRSSNTPSNLGPLKSTFKAYEALSQRGKGGVYRALDLGSQPAQFCVIKEGRRHGETDWDGRDGRWRIDHERIVLDELRLRQIPVPRIISQFEESANAYLALEYIEGTNLQRMLLQEDQLSLSACLYLAERIASLLASIHEAGWAWRDCKPLNLILCRDGQIRPLDFEGGSRIYSPDLLPWGTTGYVPPEWAYEASNASHVAQDLYGLGMTIRQILTGDVPSGFESASSLKISRRLPRGLRNLIESLMNRDPTLRPPADVFSRELTGILSSGHLLHGRAAIERIAMSSPM